jgi:hypothetical protein
MLCFALAVLVEEAKASYITIVFKALDLVLLSLLLLHFYVVVFL